MKIARTAAALLALSIPAFATADRPEIGVDIPPYGSQTVWPSIPDQQVYRDELQNIGVRMTRFDLAWWSIVGNPAGDPPDPEAYIWNGSTAQGPGYLPWDTDDAVDGLLDRGVHTLGLLCYGHPTVEDGGGPRTAAGRQAFANYARAAALYFGDRIQYWQIWNEPNLEFFWGRPPNAQDYAALAIEAAQAIREAQPDAYIVGGSVSGPTSLSLTDSAIQYLQTTFQEGLLEHVDAISINPYRINAPETVNPQVERLRELIAENTTRDIDIWVTEWGYNTAWSEINETTHAMMLLRMLVNNMSQDIKMTIWFTLHPFNEALPPGSTHNAEWALIDFPVNDYRRRPAYLAMQTLHQRLPAPIAHDPDNALNVRLGNSVANSRVELFQHDANTHTAAIWRAHWPVSNANNRIAAPLRLEVPTGTEVALYDGLNNEPIAITTSRDGDDLVIENFEVRDYPVFLDIELPTPDTSISGWLILQ